MLFTKLGLRAVSAALHTPQLGGPRCHRGFNSVLSPLSTQGKLRSPKVKYEALEISEFRGAFERKVLMHYSYFGPLWKQDIYTLQLLFGPLWKQSSLLIHYSCCWALLKARYFTHYCWKGGTRQVPPLPSKRTTVYNPDNDLIWEYETDWTNSGSSDKRTFSSDVHM